MKRCKYCGRENPDDATSCRECGTKFSLPEATPRPKRRPEPTLPIIPPNWQFRDLTPEEMKQDLVTLLTCPNIMDADVIVGRLGSVGIEAFIPDEYTAQTMAWNLNAIGFVRVQVAPGDYERAKNFLLESQTAPPNDRNDQTGGDDARGG